MLTTQMKSVGETMATGTAAIPISTALFRLSECVRTSDFGEAKRLGAEIQPGLRS
jgi:carbamoylphosphate synthase large subunit